MRERLNLPPGCAGFVALWRYRGRNHAPHRHDELELNIVRRGTGRYLVDELCLEVGRDSSLWLFPAQEHILVDQTPGLEMRVVVFAPELVRRTCSTQATKGLMAARPAGPPSALRRTLERETAARLDAFFAELMDHAGDPARFNAGLAYGLAWAWAEHQRAGDAGAGSELHPAVERAVRVLREAAGQVGLEALAERAGASPTHLSRLFKAQTGVPLARFRNRLRVERFLALYGEGRRRTLLRAALEAGFGSYPQFHRVFKALMGRGPAEHRRQRRKADALEYGCLSRGRRAVP